MARRILRSDTAPARRLLNLRVEVTAELANLNNSIGDEMTEIKGHLSTLVQALHNMSTTLNQTQAAAVTAQQVATEARTQARVRLQSTPAAAPPASIPTQIPAQAQTVGPPATADVSMMTPVDAERTYAPANAVDIPRLRKMDIWVTSGITRPTAKDSQASPSIGGRALQWTGRRGIVCPSDAVKLMDHAAKNEIQENNETKRQLYSLLHTQSTVHCSSRDICIINSNFIDSGATMDGVSPRFCSANGLWDQVVDHKEPMEITLAAKQTMTVPAKTVKLTVFMDNFEPYINDFLVIEVPEDQDLLLGMPWLKATNPDIDRVNERVKPRVSHNMEELDTNTKRPAVKVEGQRQLVSPRKSKETEGDYFTHGFYSATSGTTKFITAKQFRRMLCKPKDIECIFAIRPKMEKESGKEPEAVDIEAFSDHPVYPVLLKHILVFQQKLPSCPPPREHGEHKMEVDTQEANFRRQWRQSPGQEKVIMEWVQEMRAAGFIRPLTAPHGAPTFCVKKSVGWRIVHDYRAMNSHTIRLRERVELGLATLVKEATERYADDPFTSALQRHLSAAGAATTPPVRHFERYSCENKQIFYRAPSDERARLVLPNISERIDALLYEFMMPSAMVTQGWRGHSVWWSEIIIGGQWRNLQTAELYRDRIFVLHGIPEELLSDPDSKFTSELWTNLCEMLGTRQKLTTAFRQQENGVTERVNQAIENYLRAYTNSNSDDWDKYISLAEFAYNVRYKASIGMSPFEADIGYLPATPALSRIITSVQIDEPRLGTVPGAAARCFGSSDFHAGTTKKILGPRWIDPYNVVEQVGHDYYRLQLPERLKLHPVFHTSLLKPYIASNRPDQDIFKVRVPDGSEGELVEDIVGYRNRKGKKEYHINGSVSPN
ncbi:hypothetical protein ON010_g1372 [Phytophthora cinnamomi]|nr:hypothetical protein ON010_g1372 [Phytophthora cinnamomi]